MRQIFLQASKQWDLNCSCYRVEDPDAIVCETRIKAPLSSKKFYVSSFLIIVFIFIYIYLPHPSSISTPRTDDVIRDCSQGNAKIGPICKRQPQPWLKRDSNEKESEKLQILLETDEKRGIHIVGTQFCRQQGKCKHLLQARLELFENICVPSMKNQDTQRFLWIIYGPHDLDKTTQKRLIDMVADYPNFGVIFPEPSEDPGSTLLWKARRHMLQNSGELETVYLKDKRALDFAITTMLDADDGLHQSAISRIQSSLTNSPQAACFKSSLEWLPTKNSLGHLRKVHDECDHCHTAGLSLRTSFEKFFDYNVFWMSHTEVHQQLHDKFRECSCPQNDAICACKCFIDMTPKESSIPGVYRSRTIAADGYANVVPELLKSESQKWDVIFTQVKAVFGVSREGFDKIHEYFQEHQAQIIEEAVECSDRLFSRLPFTEGVQKRAKALLDHGVHTVRKSKAHHLFILAANPWIGRILLFLTCVLCLYGCVIAEAEATTRASKKA